MAVVDSMPGLEGHSAVLVSDYMLVYGGKVSARKLNPFVFALNLTTLRWQRLACAGSVPPPRAFHSAAMFNWKMLVFGGLLCIGLDDIHYNTYNVFSCADALDESTLLVKGQDRLKDPKALRRVTQQKLEANALYALDLQNEPTWSSVVTGGCIPPTRAHHACTIYRTTMYVFGGYSVHTTARQTDEEVKALYQVYAPGSHNNGMASD